MPKFSEQFQKPYRGEECEGVFDCQVCGESVQEAYYNSAERLLQWWCSEGHFSFIKDLVL